MTMMTKQIIKEKLDNLTDEQLNQVYGIIEELTNINKQEKKSSLMSQIKDISISESEDFSRQIAISLGRDISE